ncbi:MAG: membrane protein insertase YidC [Chthoniobacterales bacterium]
MDRKTWIAVGLSILGIVLWQWYYNVTYGPYLKQQEAERIRKQTEMAAAAASATPGDPTAPATGQNPIASAPAGVEAAATAAPTAAVMTAQTEIVSAGPGADYEFNNDTGGIDEAILLMHLGENREAVHINQNLAVPIGALSFTPGAPLGGFEMKADTVRRTVVFTNTLPDGLEITKTFTVADADASPSVDEEDAVAEMAPYLTDLEITFRNTGNTPIRRDAYFLSAGASEPIHVKDLPTYTRFDWDQEGDMESIDVNWFGGSSIPLVGISLRDPSPKYVQSGESIRWAAVTSQYFCTIITPSGETLGNQVFAERFTVPNESGTTVHGMRGALGMPGFDLAPGEVRSETFQIYTGPKDLAIMRELGAGQEEVMNFGMFGFVSKFLLWAMNFFHGFLGSYAASIILLTLCIKTALWPLQNKATQSMKRMSLLSPKMTELREKYKDEPQKMNEELMKLYRDYGVNPFSGCLPMLVQIPIFFGFYSMLGSAIELRNSSFFWINDLSQPDTVARIGGFPINLLPLLMAGTMVWQMAITPKTGDKNQQRMMMFMPVIFVVFAYNYASALSLYWTTQNLFSIVQLYLTRNQPLPQLEKKAPAAKRGQPEPRKKKRQRRSLP